MDPGYGDVSFIPLSALPSRRSRVFLYSHDIDFRGAFGTLRVAECFTKPLEVGAIRTVGKGELRPAHEKSLPIHRK